MSGISGSKVLVTGAGGFIGSHLVERLVHEGATVRALLRYDSQNRLGHLSALPEVVRQHIEVVRGDLKDPEGVRCAVDGCEIVFHLGALIAIPFSYQNPTDYVQTNVLGTLHILNACLAANTKRVIHTSTSEVYGTARFVPITLDHPRQAQSPYSASKIAADALVGSYALSFDLPAIILRPFNTYGPRQSPRAVIPTIVRQALASQTVHLGSTHPTRDFLYVADTVAGFIAAGTVSHVHPGTEIQIGTGIETSMGQIVDYVGQIMGKRLRLITDDSRIRPALSEVQRLLCDYSKAQELLEWRPRVEFVEGLRQVIDSMRGAPSEPALHDVHDYVV